MKIKLFSSLLHLLKLLTYPYFKVFISYYYYYYYYYYCDVCFSDEREMYKAYLTFLESACRSASLLLCDKSLCFCAVHFRSVKMKAAQLGNLKYSYISNSESQCWNKKVILLLIAAKKYYFMYIKKSSLQFGVNLYH